MTRQEAIEYIEDNGCHRAYIYFRDRPGPGFPYVDHVVWLENGTGDLMTAHPTDPKAAPIPAPIDATYQARVTR